MILAIRCDKPSFKKIEFKKGLNIILADRTKESDTKDSRNGLGKSTLIEIIHFCLGSKISGKDNVLGNEMIKGWTFSMDMEISGRKITINRNTEKSNIVTIIGDFTGLPIQPNEDTVTGEKYLKIDDWNDLLGSIIFGLPTNQDDKYTPTFRSLISYFVRRGRDAFSTPFEHYRKQLEWDKQVNNAFLLGLQWESAQKWQVLRDQENVIKNLKGATKTGLMSNLLGNMGDLEVNKFQLEQKISRETGQLNSFKVHPQYEGIEKRANELTAKIHENVNSIVSEQLFIDYYQKSYEDEGPVEIKTIVEVYEQARVLFPEYVTQRLVDVENFHQNIILNRKNFLINEIDRLKKLVDERKNIVKSFTEERANLLSILQTHGALEEYNRLQQLHLQTVSQHNEITAKIENLKKIEHGKSEIRIAKETLLITARAENEARQSSRESAISFFNSNSEALYNVPGKLIIDIGPTGFIFEVVIERSASQGIEQMKVFCYDLMLAQIWSTRNVAIF